MNRHINEIISSNLSKETKFYLIDLINKNTEENKNCNKKSNTDKKKKVINKKFQMKE